MSLEEPITTESPIEVLRPHLHTRPFSALVREGLGTIGDLCEQTESYLLATPGFGRPSLETIRGLLAPHGLRLASK